MGRDKELTDTKQTVCNSHSKWFFDISLFVFLIFFACTGKLNAQQDTLVKQEPRIVVMARPQKTGKVLLRWAVTTPLAWRKLNEYGYELKRYTITRNNTRLSLPEEKTLGVFKPESLESWMAIVEENDYAAVVAQSIYGENFNVEGMDELSAIINLAEEQEQRFTWGLYAADQDFEVAQMAGMGFVDKDVKPKEKYIYKVTSKVPDTLLPIEEGGVFVGLQDFEELPQPLDLAAVFFDSKSLLSWNYATYNQTYNSYFIERSEDGIDFKRLNDLPLTSLNNSEKTDPLRMFYTDSITNGQIYYYRLKGKTPFGEVGPASETISGEGEEQLPFVPHITTKYFLDDTSVLLEWEFLEKGNILIEGFELNRSDQANGVYKKVMRDIPPEARKIKYDGLQPTNYLTITALGKNGSKRTSFPTLVQPVDSVPPQQPKGLRGTIDSLGVVTLKWEPNMDKDILGYRVFKGNNKTEEFTQITISPHQANTYYDSVSIKNLNPKVYYQLIAVDQRFNMSEPSKILELKKPDIIKPNSPVFKSYKIKDGKVHLVWANSSSEDVVRHEVYRKARSSEEWVLVHEISVVGSKQRPLSEVEVDAIDGVQSKGSSKDSSSNAPLQTAKLLTNPLPTTNWTDKNVKEGEAYRYTIIAIDDSNLESDPAPPLTLIVPKTSLRSPLSGLYADVDREIGSIALHWQPYKEQGALHIVIYKGMAGKAKSVLKEISIEKTGLVDRKVKPNNAYEYLFRVIFSDGGMSEISELSVKY